MEFPCEKVSFREGPEPELSWSNQADILGKEIYTSRYFSEGLPKAATWEAAIITESERCTGWSVKERTAVNNWYHLDETVYHSIKTVRSQRSSPVRQKSIHATGLLHLRMVLRFSLVRPNNLL